MNAKSTTHYVRRAWLAFCISCILAMPSASADRELPLLGDNAPLNLKQEVELGRGLYLKLKEKGYVIEDPLLSRYISDIGESLLSSMHLRLRDYNFYLVKDASVNAFATPGGYIGIHVGLISMCRREDELASVLAHEIAHVKLMHGMQLLEKARDANLAGMISILAAILLSGQDSDLAGALIYTGAAGTAQTMVNFTRANEYEADRVGVNLLNESDYDPAAMADFMRLLQSREQSGALSDIEYIRTHPVSSNRIAEIQARTRETRKKQEKFRRFEQFRDYLAHLYPGYFPTGRSGTFAQALKMTTNGQFMAAESMYRKLIESDPDSIWYNYALAENLQQSGDSAAAEDMYRSLYLLYPDDFAIGLKLARVLAEQGADRQALDILLALEQRHAKETQLYPLLVDLYGRMNKAHLKQLAEANYHWFSGNQDQAKKLYKSLLEMAVLDVQNEEIIKLRLSQK